MIGRGWIESLCILFLHVTWRTLRVWTNWPGTRKSSESLPLIGPPAATAPQDKLPLKAVAAPAGFSRGTNSMPSKAAAVTSTDSFTKLYSRYSLEPSISGIERRGNPPVVRYVFTRERLPTRDRLKAGISPPRKMQDDLLLEHQRRSAYTRPDHGSCSLERPFPSLLTGSRSRNSEKLPNLPNARRHYPCW